MTDQPLKGKYGKFGGQFVPETLISALEELEEEYASFMSNQEFSAELSRYLSVYAGRPTPLYHAKNLSKIVGGARIYLKREDLLHSGAHKINNTLGQGLLAKKMGKSRVIAETGAGQHGVATAMACSMLNLKSEIYMGLEDTRRQRLNVFRMKLLGAEVHEVETGSKTLKDAINEALRDWVTNVQSTYYLIGSVVGPHPYPMIVRNFQSIIGSEVREQIEKVEGRMPDVLVACVGGGSNAIGTFHPFLAANSVKMVGVEAAGEGIDTGKHSATLCAGYEGVFHGMLTYILQDEYGQIRPTHSISAGLDYPGVGPEHAFLKSTGRVNYVSVTDSEAVDAFVKLAKYEGIIPALEPAHALAYTFKLAAEMAKDQLIVVTLSGRGDKDVDVVANYLGDKV